jgi:hypothetical protein
MDFHPGLKAIVDSSGTMISWALAVAAGSVVALVSTSYERPKTPRGRTMYLLFPPAWTCLGASVYCGQQISQRFIAAQLSADPENVRKILEQMNGDYVRQSGLLIAGLAILLVWLLCFVVWWIWCAPTTPPKKVFRNTID